MFQCDMKARAECHTNTESKMKGEVPSLPQPCCVNKQCCDSHDRTKPTVCLYQPTLLMTKSSLTSYWRRSGYTKLTPDNQKSHSGKKQTTLELVSYIITGYITTRVSNHGGFGGIFACELALRSTGTFLSFVQAWPDRGLKARDHFAVDRFGTPVQQKLTLSRPEAFPRNRDMEVIFSPGHYMNSVVKITSALKTGSCIDGWMTWGSQLIQIAQ
ncbi:hypothetical protein PoB_003027300 [Plakobranchus ocellatus]|uniref:Uncharacterized protein n=1 Tax=Plakobranchus ocellatus TaxID=259542 RepID=A0AAV4AAJ3_9GAST|nr:hypothetical protein PoB_003027300 [Plakobranchus ocellatus]